MTSELGLCLLVAESIPLGDGEQPSAALVAHARVRPVPLAAIELSSVIDPASVELTADGLGFLGGPGDDVVVSPFLGVGVRLTDGPHVLAASGFSIDTVLFPVLDLRADTRVSWSDDRGVSVVLAVGPALHSPRGFDADGDGVSDRADLCDDDAEDPDGYLDADGCPDPDNDGDTVLDAGDSCPAVPEDRDSFLDGDGCPEPDNDGDRLFDDRDACINAPEDEDGFRDLDGCPDPDNDGDTVADADDRCPNVAEDADAWEDADGCPDPDNDGDGVGDAFDLASSEPENINFFEDEDGKPEALPPLLAKVTGAQPKIRFEGHRLSGPATDRAELIAAALAQWPAVRVRLLVVDPDLERAQKRALSLAAAVVQLGVLAERVEPVGEQGDAAVRVELMP